MKQLLSGRTLLLLLLLVLAAGAALLMWTRQPAPPEAPPVTAPEPRPLREVQLYFAAADGAALVAESRQIEDCPEAEEACLRATVRALLDGPVGDLLPVLPGRAVLRGLAVEGGTVVLDFSRELVADHPGGSSSELLSVYALANTLAENYPHLRQVRLLVEGEAVETLRGHVDLRQPVHADFSFSRTAGAAAPVGVQSEKGE